MRSSSLRPVRTLMVIGVAIVALGACGTSELPVDPGFDGSWLVSELETNDRPVAVAGGGLVIEIDTGEAAVRGRTGCGPFFGSYTLSDGEDTSGSASFTIPSPAPDPSCPEAERDLHQILIAALETVTRWDREPSTPPRLELTGPASTRVLLTPAG